MARPLRICVPGGLYHVITRGNAREAIVRDEFDRQSFFRILARTVKRFSWLCHAYCLMDNHYHLVLETPLPNLSAGMRQLNGVYAQAFNEHHGRVGHVFQSRYRSILVEDETYFVEVCRYVVLNPVRGGSCAAPDEWTWSSYAATAGLTPPPPYLAIERILSEFGSTRPQAYRNYRLFVADGIGKAAELEVKGERLGGDAFLQKTFGLAAPLPEIPRVQVEPMRAPLEEIFERELKAPIAVAYRRHGYTLRQIAEYVGCSYSTISRRLRQEERQVAA
jgi:REP-associated tyrosine transposase